MNSNRSGFEDASANRASNMEVMIDLHKLMKGLFSCQLVRQGLVPTKQPGSQYLVPIHVPAPDLFLTRNNRTSDPLVLYACA